MIERAPANELWNAWRSSAEIREVAEGLITKPEGDWSSDDEAIYAILHREPDAALSAIFAAIQLTDDQRVLGSLAAGLLENFLGVHGRAYVDVFHTLALEHRRLREVLDGVWGNAERCMAPDRDSEAEGVLMNSPNQARHRTRHSAFRSMGFGNSRVSFVLHPRRRAGSVRLNGSGETFRDAL